MSSKWVILLFPLILAGCASGPRTLEAGNPNVTEANVARIQAGMQEAEVLAILGPADEVKAQPDGAREWLYRSSTGETVKSSTFARRTTKIRAKLLVVTLEPDGRVANVTYDERREKIY